MWGGFQPPTENLKSSRWHRLPFGRREKQRRDIDGRPADPRPARRCSRPRAAPCRSPRARPPSARSHFALFAQIPPRTRRDAAMRRPSAGCGATAGPGPRCRCLRARDKPTPRPGERAAPRGNGRGPATSAAAGPTRIAAPRITALGMRGRGVLVCGCSMTASRSPVRCDPPAQREQTGPRPPRPPAATASACRNPTRCCVELSLSTGRPAPGRSSCVRTLPGRRPNAPTCARKHRDRADRPSNDGKRALAVRLGNHRVGFASPSELERRCLPCSCASRP